MKKDCACVNGMSQEIVAIRILLSAFLDHLLLDRCASKMPRKATTPLGAQLQLLNKAVSLTKRAIKAQQKQRRASERLQGVQTRIGETGVRVEMRDDPLTDDGGASSSRNVTTSNTIPFVGAVCGMEIDENELFADSGSQGSSGNNMNGKSVPVLGGSGAKRSGDEGAVPKLRNADGSFVLKNGDGNDVERGETLLPKKTSGTVAAIAMSASSTKPKDEADQEDGEEKDMDDGAASIMSGEKSCDDAVLAAALSAAEEIAGSWS